MGNTFSSAGICHWGDFFLRKDKRFYNLISVFNKILITCIIHITFFDCRNESNLMQLIIIKN